MSDTLAHMTDRGYCRISLDTKASGSITKQKAQIRSATGNDIEWYVDESVSGAKVPFNDREGGGALLNDLQSGDRVFVTKIDRAARSVKDLLNLVQHIKDAGASIVFTEQKIDTDDVYGQFMLTLLGAIAELEANIIAERRRESLVSFNNEGRHAIGKAPFGFHSVPNPKGRGLVIRPHPEESVILLDAITRVLSGEAHEKVAESIGMSKSGFSRLIRNPRLAGMTPLNGGVVTIEGVPRIDPETAIMSLVEYTNLQEVLNKTDKGWNRHGGIGPALSCSECGERLYFGASKRNADYSTYKCRRVHPIHKAEGRPSASVIAKNVEEYVEAEYLRRFGSQQHMTVEIQDTNTERSEAVALARLTLQEIRRQQDAAQTDDEEEALYGQYLKAKRALREAEAIPSSRKEVWVPSGHTLAEEWQLTDADGRVLLLKAMGQWQVKPGRLPIEEKVELVEPDVSRAIGELIPFS